MSKDEYRNAYLHRLRMRRSTPTRRPRTTPAARTTTRPLMSSALSVT
jgi:hypothetical protein